jgi:NADH-quinone oxidoreductase subunit K
MLFPFERTSIELSNLELHLTEFDLPSMNELGLSLALPYLVFLIGLVGMIVNYKNFLVMMMTVEVMYVGVILSLLTYASAALDIKASIYALLLLVFAACESAIGLGLLIVLHRFDNGELRFDYYTTLRG